MLVFDLDIGGLKINKYLNTGIWIDKYVKVWYNVVSVLLEERIGCYESLEVGIFNFVEGYMGKVIGEVMFGWILKDV